MWVLGQLCFVTEDSREWKRPRFREKSSAEDISDNETAYGEGFLGRQYRTRFALSKEDYRYRVIEKQACWEERKFTRRHTGQ